MKNDPRSCEHFYAIAYLEALKKIQDFNKTWTHELAIEV